MLGLMLVCRPLCAEQLASFAAITEYLNLGNSITAVMHTQQCVIKNPNGYEIKPTHSLIKPSFVLYTEKVIAFDANKFAAGPPSAPQNRIKQRMSFNLDPKGEMKMIVGFFDGETNKKVPDIKDITVNCQLGEGFVVYEG